MRLLESAQNDSVVRNEFAAEVGRLVDGVDGFFNFFLDNMIISRLRLPLLSNINFLNEFCVREFASFDVYFAELIIQQRSLLKFLRKICWVEHAGVRADDDVGLVGAEADDELANILRKINKLGLARLHNRQPIRSQNPLLNNINYGVLQRVACVDLGTDQRRDQLGVRWGVEALVDFTLNIIILHMLPELIEV